MTDQLRRRRDALLQELRELEARLVQEPPATGWPPAPWHRQAARAPQYLALLDSRLRVRYVNRLQPGADPSADPSVFTFVAEGQHALLRAALEEARASGLPQYFETESLGPNGERTWYSSWVVPIAGHDDLRLAVIAADVSHERRIEQELDDEKSLLASLVAHAPDAVLVVGRDHRIQFINSTRTGRRREDVIGHPAEEFVAPEYRQRVEQAIEQVFETGQPTAYDTRVATDQGEFWYSVRVGPVIQDDRVTRVSMVSTDITDQVNRERAREHEQALLEESERRFRTLVDNAPEALVVLDVDTGRFVDVNDNACRLFDLSRSQLLETGPVELSPEHQPDGTASSLATMSRVQDAMDGSAAVFEWTHRSADGRLIACEVRLVRLPHKDHRWVRGSITDISARKEAEAERERLTLELAQSQKLQALGQLTGGVAHDFNNLLTVIMGSLELVDLDAQASERVRGYARQALTACERAAALTQRLLAFARRQPLRPQVIDINALVLDTESLLRRTLGRGIAIQTRLADGLWPSEADPTQLENVVLNLAINARDAMPGGGKLTIETANVALAEPDLDDFEEAEPGDYVCLSVIDDGVGMEQDVQRQVFEPFFTTKPAGLGSGLGLSMVYGFVKQSRGQVRIRSAPGAGTRVDVLLPRSEAAAEPTHSGGLADSGDVPRGEGRLVLVVDDDPAVLVLVVRILEQLDYRTLNATDASGALALLDANPDVALLVSDVVLSDSVHGPELARQARARRPDLPVLFISGYADDPAVPEGRVPADLDLLEKPFTRDQLGQAVWRATHRVTEAPERDS